MYEDKLSKCHGLQPYPVQLVGSKVGHGSPEGESVTLLVPVCPECDRFCWSDNLEFNWQKLSWWKRLLKRIFKK
jgi:hypothetical protein